MSSGVNDKFIGVLWYMVVVLHKLKTTIFLMPAMGVATEIVAVLVFCALFSFRTCPRVRSLLCVGFFILIFH